MDFGAMFQTWINVLTKPGEEIFQQERSSTQATLTTALIWIIVAAVLVAIFSGLSSLVSGLIGGAGTFRSILEQADLPPEVRAQMLAVTSGGIGGGFVGAVCFSLILTPVGFFIGSGIYFLVAKLFGGTGSFEEQTYLLATFSAPLLIVNGLLGIIPFLGGCLAFFISIYQLVLTYFALKVSHNFTSGKAVAVTLTPAIVLFICFFCGIFTFLLLLGPVIGDIFNNTQF